ncbi:hypothetical protein [Humidesulfovibrio sp.]
MPHMKAAQEQTSGTHQTAVTGQDCPQTGVWQATSTALPPLLVRRGDIMPAAGGRVVTWELLHPGS